MELKILLKGKGLLLMLLIFVVYGCEGQKKKDDITINQNSCFTKQKLISEEDELIYKYKDGTYEVSINKEEQECSLRIDSVEYLTHLTLESPNINFYNYKCKNQRILIIEGDDYYSSIFFVYCLEKDNLSSLGSFQINQPNVENTGVLKKDFKITFENNNQFAIQSLLNNKVYSTTKFKDKINIPKQDEKKILNSKINLDGLWRVSCDNSLTTFDISKTEGYLSLNSNNAIYINVEITTVPEKNTESYLRFKNIESQENYYPENKKVKDDEISKTEIIGKLEFKNNQLTLIWYGLYNEVTKQREFIDKDFVMIRENGGVSPVILKRCDE